MSLGLGATGPREKDRKEGAGDRKRSKGMREREGAEFAVNICLGSLGAHCRMRNV